MLTQKEIEFIEDCALMCNVSVDEMINVYQTFKTTVIDIWEELKSFLNVFANDFVEYQKKMEQEKELRLTWHVLKNITRNHQVLNRRPLFTNIRNSI